MYNHAWNVTNKILTRASKFYLYLRCFFDTWHLWYKCVLTFMKHCLQHLQNAVQNRILFGFFFSRILSTYCCLLSSIVFSCATISNAAGCGCGCYWRCWCRCCSVAVANFSVVAHNYEDNDDDDNNKKKKKKSGRNRKNLHFILIFVNQCCQVRMSVSIESNEISS